jgi:hypothetical protein
VVKIEMAENLPSGVNASVYNQPLAARMIAVPFQNLTFSTDCQLLLASISLLEILFLFDCCTKIKRRRANLDHPSAPSSSIF